MSEVSADQNPTDSLHKRIGALFEERGLQDATEVTLESEDGGRYWIRRIQGYVQCIQCKLPIEDYYESDIQIFWNISPNSSGEMELLESMSVFGYRPDDDRSDFVVNEPELIDMSHVDDLVDDLLADAYVVEADVDDEAIDIGTNKAHVLSAINRLAISGILVSSQVDIAMVTTGAIALLA